MQMSSASSRSTSLSAHPGGRTHRLRSRDAQAEEGLAVRSDAEVQQTRPRSDPLT